MRHVHDSNPPDPSSYQREGWLCESTVESGGCILFNAQFNYFYAALV